MRSAVVVHDLGLHTVDHLEVLLVYDMVRGTDIVYVPLMHHDHLVGELGGDIDVMAYHDYQYAFLDRELLQHLGHIQLMSHIEVRGRLVEKEDLRLLDQTPGQHDLLMLSGGELVEVPHGEMGYPEHLQCVVHDIEVVVEGLPLAVGMPPHEHGVHDGEGECVVGGIRNVSDLLGHILDGDLLDVLAVEHDGTGSGGQNLVYTMYKS